MRGDSGPLLARLREAGPPRGLAAGIAERLSEAIRAGRLAPGERLPTEAELSASAGVSRTVVREAVAALKAEGLVVTRQGSGAFVASDAQARPFRIDPAGLRSLQDVIDVMELRLAVEVGSAGLAAERASRPQLAAIRAALSRMDEALGHGQAAVDQDFAFHRAIAAASGNPQFGRFLELLGRIVIPRQSIRVVERSAEAQRRYLATVQAEHARIVDAIAAGDAPGARRSMRTHLSRGLARYTALAAEPRPAPKRTPR
ncbi:MAG: hypothetical protein RJA99_1118 [Pseudomonadota bacterium]|jgi:GntR family transcriptional repressor for pyruvate dehydrogenase complex